MVGPLTSVSEFRSCVEDELTDLRKELRLDLTEQHHEISVDELKILSEEELVEKAFQASLKGGANFTRDSSEECSDGATNSSSTVDADVACSVKSGIDEDYVPSNNLPKRSRRTRNNGKFGMLLRRAKE